MHLTHTYPPPFIKKIQSPQSPRSYSRVIYIPGRSYSRVIYIPGRMFKASLSESFRSISCTLNAAPNKQDSTSCMKVLGERRKKFHHGETFGHCFTCIWCIGNGVKSPLRQKIVCFTMELCNKSCNEREVVGPVSIWNCAMKLCIERDTYFILPPYP
jgi:hypothetical protein